MRDYRTSPWYIGKRGYDKAEWIPSFLPHTPDSCYIDPFAGMECVEARDLLEQVRGCDYAVIYADPPYPTANASPYTIDYAGHRALP